MNDNVETTAETPEVEGVVEAEQAKTSEATENTTGNPEPTEEPAEAEQKAEEERRSRNKRRNEKRRRKQQEAREAAERARKLEEDATRKREAVKSLKRPKADDYADLDEFNAALATFTTLGALDEREAARLQDEARQAKEAAERIKQEQQMELQQTWTSQVEDGRSRYADFDAVALGNAPINDAMAEVIVESEMGADVAYFLGKNPDVAHAMAGGSKLEIARAIGRIEAQLENAPKPKTTTTAPEPATPVKGGAGAGKSPEKMTPDEYRAWRQSGGSF